MLSTSCPFSCSTGSASKSSFLITCRLLIFGAFMLCHALTDSGASSSKASIVFFFMRQRYEKSVKPVVILMFNVFFPNSCRLEKCRFSGVIYWKNVNFWLKKHGKSVIFEPKMHWKSVIFLAISCWIMLFLLYLQPNIILLL